MNEDQCWFEGNEFCRPLNVEFRDCDTHEQPSVTTWLSWIADVAGNDYTARGLPRSLMLENHQVFLLSRIAYRLERAPKTDERLTVRTWEKGTEAIYFYRDFEFLDAQGALCASASSVWLLCDPITHRILRPRALVGHEVGRSDKQIACGAARALTAPISADLLGDRRVVYSDLDANGHVFSANYGNLVMDFLPEDLRALPYRAFTINYVKEARLSETLCLRGKREEDRYLMIGEHSDGGTCFIAEMTY